MRVLIAEDDTVSALVLRRALERLGHEVVVAADGAAAWDALNKEGFRLLITDWMMPETDGIELCRRIRARGGPYVYVILLTAKGSREDRLEGIEAGADDFLVKPLDVEELASTLSVAQRILQMEEELYERADDLRKARDEVSDGKQLIEDTMVYLQAANQQFEELFEGMPAACITFDADGRIQRWNRDCEHLFGHQTFEVMMSSLGEVFPWWQSSAQAADTMERLLRGERTEGLEWVHTASDGSELHLLCNTIPLRGPNQTVRGGISASIDISDRKALENALAQQLQRANSLNLELETKQRELADLNKLLADQATTDGLTGLRNHRHFRAVLEDAFSKARSTGQSLSVVLLDVDFFKKYNDSFGHPAGDEVLCAVAKLLSRGARANDVVARYGGEEFVLVLPGAGRFAAMKTAERLRSAIAEHTWSLRPVTASFGAATVTQSTASSSEIVDLADQALYASKAAGRNRVTHYDDLPEAGSLHAQAA